MGTRVLINEIWYNAIWGGYFHEYGSGDYVANRYDLQAIHAPTVIENRRESSAIDASSATATLIMNRSPFLKSSFVTTGRGMVSIGSSLVYQFRFLGHNAQTVAHVFSRGALEYTGPTGPRESQVEMFARLSINGPGFIPDEISQKIAFNRFYYKPEANNGTPNQDMQISHDYRFQTGAIYTVVMQEGTYFSPGGFPNARGLAFIDPFITPLDPADTVEFSAGILNSPVGGVPEPSTWAMMILGFAGIGFMAYRRKPGQHRATIIGALSVHDLPAPGQMADRALEGRRRKLGLVGYQVRRRIARRYRSIAKPRRIG